MSSLQSLGVQEGACELVREGFEDFTDITLSRVTTNSKSHQEEIMFRGLDRDEGGLHLEMSSGRGVRLLWRTSLQESRKSPKVITNRGSK